MSRILIPYLLSVFCPAIWLWQTSTCPEACQSAIFVVATVFWSTLQCFLVYTSALFCLTKKTCPHVPSCSHTSFMAVCVCKLLRFPSFPDFPGEMSQFQFEYRGGRLKLVEPDDLRVAAPVDGAVTQSRSLRSRQKAKKAKAAERKAVAAEDGETGSTTDSVSGISRITGLPNLMISTY